MIRVLPSVPQKVRCFKTRTWRTKLVRVSVRSKRLKRKSEAKAMWRRVA